jgi:hypothetical protein
VSVREDIESIEPAGGNGVDAAEPQTLVTAADCAIRMTGDEWALSAPLILPAKPGG